MQRLSKRFYLSSPITAIPSAVILLVAGIAIMAGTSSDSEPVLVVLLVLAISGGLYASVVYLVFIYKIWDAIPDRFARTTPGKAVGFLFIPIFGIYWIFQVLWGFAKDCN